MKHNYKLASMIERVRHTEMFEHIRWLIRLEIRAVIADTV